MSILILHGWENNSSGNWFPWLKTELEKLEETVYAPDLPNSDFPKQKEWLTKINETIKDEQIEELVIVGHSMGAVAILRFLETLEEGKKIKCAILVGGFTTNKNERAGHIKAISDFFKTPFNWEKIKQSCEKFIIIASDNDPYIPMKESEKLRSLLNKPNTEFIVEHNAGHMNKESGFIKYERVLELI
ncbi:MAG: alpha/beta fold hydrolase [Candidatus Micrarchaeota archaeon]